MPEPTTNSELHRPALSVVDLHVAYGPVAAVRGVSLDVSSSEIVVVLGANGAGKSSLLNSVAGLVPATEGRVNLFGRDVSHEPAERIVRKGLALVPEGRRVFSQMSVDENLRISGAVRSRSESVESRKWLESVFPALVEKRRMAAGSLSGGQQQMLAVGRALMSDPRVLLLDEPSLGLAPVIVDEIFDLLQGLRSRGLAILLVEQNVGRALAMADRALVMANGRVIADGTGAEIASSTVLHSAYFGYERHSDD